MGAVWVERQHHTRQRISDWKVATWKLLSRTTLLHPSAFLKEAIAWAGLFPTGDGWQHVGNERDWVRSIARFREQVFIPGPSSGVTDV